MKPIPYLSVGAIRDGGPSAQAALFIGDFEQEMDKSPDRRMLHRHHFYEVFLMTSGTGVLVCDFQRIPFGPMHLVFVSPGQIHGWETDDHVRGKVLAFSTELWGATINS